jgi:hypothetical protein
MKGSTAPRFDNRLEIVIPRRLIPRERATFDPLARPVKEAAARRQCGIGETAARQAREPSR